MSQQLPLALQLPSPADLDDFIHGDAGELAHLLKEQRAGRQQLLFLHGETASGKSHLLLGQCSALQTSGAQVAYLPCREHAELDPGLLENLESLDLVAIDDVDALAGQQTWEQALFNLFNRARDSACRLLFSAALPPTRIGLQLPDLQSRLSWGVSIGISSLDDAARQQLLQHLATRRGLDMPGKVARYLIERQSRSTPDMLQLVDQLDRASMSEQKRLSIPFVREQLN